MQNRADRKKQLIAEGALYRAEVMLARQTVEAGLRPEAIARNALQQAALIGIAALKTRNIGIGNLSGVNLQAMLPMALSGIAALSRNKPLLKTVLRGVLVAGGVAGIVRLVTRERKPAVNEVMRETVMRETEDFPQI